MHPAVATFPQAANHPGVQAPVVVVAKSLRTFRLLSIFLPGAQWFYVGRPARPFIPFMGKRIGSVLWPARVLARRGFTVTGDAIIKAHR
ncbi:hypothetical protein [Actinoplanes sp. NPDC049118]|uniref:hypothetical protein n=1 Tax=Actinoplanes sp. NPDC049118 TaxID=3155769 RepID=UPI0033F3F192